MNAQMRVADGQLCNTPNQVMTFGPEHYQVFFNGRLLPASFNSKGAASAYLDGLKKGRAEV